MTPTSSAVRLVHVSDVHLSTASLRWSVRDYLSKRGAGWLNLRLFGRARRFREAERVMRALAAELGQRRPDRLVFTGDATTLGFEGEFARAAELLGVGAATGVPGFAVPGNHDYYTRAPVRTASFERTFAPWQEGEREGGATYPFAARVGPLWLIGVNSSTPHWSAINASGIVDQAQLQRLVRLLARLGPGRRILVTHYPLCLPGGRRLGHSRGLQNLDELISVATQGRVCLWLHGHEHGAYVVPAGALAPFPAICAGSLTERGHWSYGDYTIDGGRLRAVRWIFDEATDRFQDQNTIELVLPAP